MLPIEKCDAYKNFWWNRGYDDRDREYDELKAKRKKDHFKPEWLGNAY